MWPSKLFTLLFSIFRNYLDENFFQNIIQRIKIFFKGSNKNAKLIGQEYYYG